MFTARVMLSCSPEGRPSVLERLSQEAATVPTRFDGNLLYVVSVDASNDHRVMIAEEWSDRSAFDAYQQSHHFTETMSVVQPCLAAPPSSSYFEATRVGP